MPESHPPQDELVVTVTRQGPEWRADFVHEPDANPGVGTTPADAVFQLFMHRLSDRFLTRPGLLKVIDSARHWSIELEQVEGETTDLAALARAGGLARALKMSPEQRTTIARNAAIARWKTKVPPVEETLAAVLDPTEPPQVETVEIPLEEEVVPL